MSAEEDQDKLDRIKKFMLEEDEDDALNDWETNFIEDQSLKSAITDREFSHVESEKIDEIYNKLWRNGYI